MNCAHRFAAGDISPIEVTHHCLERAGQINAALSFEQLIANDRPAAEF